MLVITNEHDVIYVRRLPPTTVFQSLLAFMSEKNPLIIKIYLKVLKLGVKCN